MSQHWVRSLPCQSDRIPMKDRRTLAAARPTAGVRPNIRRLGSPDIDEEAKHARHMSVVHEHVVVRENDLKARGGFRHASR